MSESIYKLNESMRQLLELDQDDQAVKDTIEGLEMMTEEKCVNIIKYVKHLESKSNEVAEEVTRLSYIKSALDKQIGRLKESVLIAMELNELDKIDDTLYPIKRVKPRKVCQIDESILDKKWIVTKETISTRVDKTAITKALKDGEEVKGAELVDGKKSIKY